MFEGAKLKIRWADRHIYDLNSVIGDFIKSDFYTLTNEFDAQAGCYSISISIEQNAPPEMPLFIGDAIHSLRVALDHIAAEIVGISSSGISFPFHERRQNHVTAEGTLKGHANTIEQAERGLGFFILDEIRPYADGNGNKILWSLSKLDNIDKHKLIIPVFSVASVTAYDLYDEEKHISIGALTGTLSGEGKLNIVGTNRPLKIRGKIEPSFDVLFGPATFFENQPVIKTLREISNSVSETLRRIEEFITGNRET